MDKIIIKRLRVPALVGVFPQERLAPQNIFIDLEISCDCKSAASSDHLADTVDYRAVVVRLTEYIEGTNFQLLETLAEALADLIIKEFRVAWLRLRIIKNAFDIPNTDGVGVEIERTTSS